jgi:hypothetical protein
MFHIVSWHTLIMVFVVCSSILCLPLHLVQMLPLTTNIRDAYKQGTNDEQNFLQNLSLFLCTFLKEHGALVEKRKECHEALLEVMCL